MDTSFDFADVVDEAVQRSGGEQSTAADVVTVRRSLRLLTERWEAKGYNTWRVRETTIICNGRSRSYDLPRSIDDVLQVNYQTHRGGSESPLTRITAAQYAQISTKDTAGNCSQFYLSREDTPRLFVYPVGHSTAEGRLSIWYVERPERFDRYEDGPMADLPGRWLEALVAGLSLDLARKRPMEGGQYNEPLIARLKEEYREAEDIALRADRDRARYRYRISM